jgi:hypothetical protein
MRQEETNVVGKSYYEYNVEEEDQKRDGWIQLTMI